MNLLYAELVDAFEEDGMRLGRVRVGGAMRKVGLDLVADVRPGDDLLLCDGVAIARVENEPFTTSHYVPRDSR